jgi:hypothetical protein
VGKLSLAVGIVLWAGVATVFGQTPSQESVKQAISPIADQVKTDEKTDPISAIDSEASGSSAPQIWLQGEYLWWRLKNRSPDFPLVTTGDPAKDPTAGALGSSSTRVLERGADLDHGVFSGLRFTVGGWVDQEKTWGLEASGFLTEQRRNGFAAGSDATGNQSLYVPVFLPDFGGEGKFIIADPTVPFQGSIAVSSATRLWGAEVNAFCPMFICPNFTMDFLFGFRYLSMQDSLGLNALAPNDPVSDIQSVLSERFATHNDFYGGQIGLRGEYRIGRLSLDMVAKVALGSAFQSVDVSGQTTLTGTGVLPVLGVPPGTYPGAIFAQPTNSGRRSIDKFDTVSQLMVKAGWDLSSRFRVFVGYDFLFWNNVSRAGEQLDRQVNSAQSPLSPNFGKTVIPAVPAAVFTRSEFWAYGGTVGLEFRY